MTHGCVKQLHLRRRLVTVLLCVIMMLSLQVALGAKTGSDSPRKPAWKWTLDERLASRFDPDAIDARMAEQREAAMRARDTGEPTLVFTPTVKSGPGSSVVIDGSKTPELYLPWELFSALLARGFPPREGRDYVQQERAAIERRAAALGFGSDLWARLEKVAAPALRLQREEEARFRTHIPSIKKGQEVSRLRLCRARAQALAAAKAEFGEEPFLRLLYEVVAAKVQRVYIIGPLGFSPADADELRFVARGCR